MKIKDLRNLSLDELAAQRAELKQEMVNLRIQSQVGQLENPSRLRLIRRTIARIETLISERANAAA
jgi:large subunit ribosomal protein L29